MGWLRREERRIAQHGSLNAEVEVIGAKGGFGHQVGVRRANRGNHKGMRGWYLGTGWGLPRYQDGGHGGC